MPISYKADIHMQIYLSKLLPVESIMASVSAKIRTESQLNGIGWQMLTTVALIPVLPHSARLLLNLFTFFSNL